MCEMSNDYLGMTSLCLLEEIFLFCRNIAYCVKYHTPVTVCEGQNKTKQDKTKQNKQTNKKLISK